jgi:hypothetical protein
MINLVLGIIHHLMKGVNSVIFDEIFPIWSLLDPKKNGLGFTTFQIGLTASFTGLL